ncbi:DUF3488 and transglutaminase-like domain-containing protein [Kingella sp. (in: b-proteobacteria)]|uniref:transglutaminase family protein n=1 Tax=Kingella sp. (in: b-proteobacteria) TaxID=2020713 RepID=UPI0026DBC3F1|nr:DUF3488 and transglutaminase-like domain-containing protein [Kingella sp. (in: b-proteobacteria)]MDO4658707.1 DUF3488 and transglutaminase-like domain-containing protein [Kingella sp. (in: b-proteobacteria)]
MLIANPTYLHADPDLKAILANQLALFCVSLPILNELPFVVSVIFILMMAVRILLLFFGVRKMAMWQLVLMLALVVALVMLQVGSFVGLQGGMALLLLLGALKSYEGHTRRDWQVAALVQIFLLTGAVLFNQSMLVGAWVLVCLTLIAVALAILNELDPKTALKQSLIGFALTLLPMILLFITMPRKESPLWGIPQNPSNQSTTGISESMKPGSIGNLVQSNEPAFTATFKDNYRPRPQDLYWRVMVMIDRDEMGEWHAAHGMMDGAYPARGNRPTANVSYQIVLEDTKGRIPALDYPSRRQDTGILQELGNVLRVYSRQGVRGITLYANATDELTQKLDANEMQLYTAISNNNPQTKALAQSLYQQAGGDTSRFVQAAYQYFNQQKFAYTLKPPVLQTGSPTDEFLFKTKQGFCEHYADAFVTLMRSVGVPARVVTGYQGGEWNEQGGFWQIRSKDAHAWAEVWLPERNVWKRVDPTAAVSISRVDSGVDSALPAEEINELVSNLSAWNRFTSQSQIYWQRWVVNFDNAQQNSLFSLLMLGGASKFSSLLLLIIGSVPVLIPIIWWWRRSRQQDIAPLADGFMLLKRRLLGNAYPNLAALGATELKAELEQDNRLTPDLDQLLQDFIALNYASSQAPSATAAQAWYRRARRLSNKYRAKSEWAA